MEETRSLAPVILFTYNRPEHTKRTIEALAANELAAETDLYVFSDAAKKDADKGKVQEIRDYVKSVQGIPSGGTDRKGTELRSCKKCDRGCDRDRK